MNDLRPQIRPGLAAEPDDDDPRYIHLWDRLRISQNTLRLPRPLFECVRLMDGERTLAEIQGEAKKESHGILVPTDALHELLRYMDEAMFLSGPRFEAALTAPVREPNHIGCYSADPAELRAQFRRAFTGPGGPGLPGELRPDGRLRAALVPHIDYARGGAAYPAGFKEIVERSDASLFVIIATSHFSPERFTLTGQHFGTPLGVVETDQAYVDRLVKHYGEGLFDDPFAHFPEHSVELEVVYLHYLFENVRPIRIVPLVVGSFGDCVQGKGSPRGQADIAAMIRALQKAEEETPEPICYVVSGDLAHIGPKFDDPEPVAEPLLSHSQRQDLALMEAASGVSADRYFGIIEAEKDGRRICGLPPTYTMLEAVQPRSGRLQNYGQYVHPEGFESVSFASMTFDR